MKRILAALLAMLLLALPALAESAVYEGNGYTVELPERLAVLPAETVQGYFAGAAADVGEAGEEQAVSLDAMMVAATEDGAASVNIIFYAADGRTALEEAEVSSAELAEIVDGLSAADPETVAYGEVEFARVGYTLYGNSIEQYFTVSGDTLYIVTCTNLEAEEIEQILSSLTF